MKSGITPTNNEFLLCRKPLQDVIVRPKGPWQSLAQQAEKAPYRLVAESIVPQRSPLVAYFSEAGPVFGRPIEIIGSAFNCCQWNGAEVPAVLGEIAIVPQNETVMLGNRYLCEIR